jgi:leucyl-tRNA synthetase
LYNSWFNPETNKAEPIDTLKYPADCTTEESKRTYRDSKRLAYNAKLPVWWCSDLGTVLANEEIIEGKSEIGGFPVVRKPLRQWVLRITAYADRLLEDLAIIDWSDSLKKQQTDWIGRSEGAEVDFQIADSFEKIRVFTTRPDTLFGATYMVLSPDHLLVQTIASDPQKTAVNSYQQEVAGKSDRERTDATKEKTGVFTGAYAINPVNGEKIPIWIADYVLAGYGTGAIMAVPAHDERDFEFAKKFNLPIVQVVQPPDTQTDWHGFVGNGTSVNSGFISGLPTGEAKTKITAWLEEKGLGKKTINYKLRDWLFSRQRYWGEPFPLIWKRSAEGELYHEGIAATELPVMPPQLDDFKPTPGDEPRPPLGRAKEWANLPGGVTRELNTMPQWAGSCWYYLRYLDAKNNNVFVGKEAEYYWMGEESYRLKSAITKGGTIEKPTAAKSLAPGVDLYVGGTEHAVLHLLYARFWHKVLFDLGYVSTPEPFYKLVNQGLILGEDGQKMSKSRGNVVNPDDILKEFGADAFRLYEMFMGPLQDVKPWSTKGVEGVYRFLGRVWRLFVDENSETAYEQAETTTKEPSNQELLDLILLDSAIADQDATPAQLKTLHACIKKVTEDLDGLRFNTAISAMMVFVNEATSWQAKPLPVMKTFLQLLAPFAPHLAEELWARLHSTFGQVAPSLSYAPWPKFDPALLVESEIELPVQVNGKFRDVIKIAVDADNATIEATAKSSEKVASFIAGKPIKKVIIVPKKMVNLIVA